MHTSKVTKLARDFEITPGDTLELCRIEANQAVTLHLKLLCNEYEADDCLPVRILDKQGRVVSEDEFVPVIGKFRLETVIAKECLPLRVLVENQGKLKRRIKTEVKYAEVAT